MSIYSVTQIFHVNMQCHTEHHSRSIYSVTLNTTPCQYTVLHWHFMSICSVTLNIILCQYTVSHRQFMSICSVMLNITLSIYSVPQIIHVNMQCHTEHHSGSMYSVTLNTTPYTVSCQTPPCINIQCHIHICMQCQYTHHINMQCLAYTPYVHIQYHIHHFMSIQCHTKHNSMSKYSVTLIISPWHVNVQCKTGDCHMSTFTV